MKGYKTPLALAIVIALLAGLAYWDEKKTGTDKITSEEKSKLYDFKAADIESMDVINPSSDPAQWSMKKSEDGKSWQVVSPISYAADSDGVLRFLKILEDAKFERRFDQSDKEMKGFGLDKPLLRYSLKDKNGKIYLFSVGGKSPTGYASYVQTTDPAHLFLVNQYLFTATNKGLLDFRNRSLFVPPAAEIQSVEMIWPNLPSLKVARKDKDWELITPIQAKADSGEVNKAINGWDQIRVVAFIDSPVPALRKALSEIGKGTKEYVRLRFERNDAAKSVKEILVIENNGKLYTKFNDDVFAELEKHQIDELKRSAHDLEDRTMFTFVSPDITEFNFDSKHYHKVDKRWVEGPENKRADYVQGILAGLEFAKADQRLTTAEGLSLTKLTPSHKAELKQGDKVVASITIWKKPDVATDLILKTGENYYQVKQDFLDIFTPKMPEPTAAGDAKGEKS